MEQLPDQLGRAHRGASRSSSLFDLGVKVTINSDDPEVLETNLNNEYRIAHEVLGMSLEDIAVCNRFACEASLHRRAEKIPHLHAILSIRQTCMRARFPATVHLLLFRGVEVLLLRRRNTGYRDGEYSLPAGHLDGGETVIAVGVREASEEIGVQIPPEALTFSSVMHRHEGEERIDFFLVVERWEGEPYNAEPEKCDDLRWVSLSSLPVYHPLCAPWLSKTTVTGSVSTSLAGMGRARQPSNMSVALHRKTG